MRDTRSCMGTMNKNCVSDCSDKAIKTTPIALSVPQRKICSDEDIKKCMMNFVRFSMMNSLL